MDQATHNKIVSFIWGIADDVLRDLFKRGKYPDVILPMCVLRPMDAVLEPTNKALLETKVMMTATIKCARSASRVERIEERQNWRPAAVRRFADKKNNQQLKDS
jgi:type I restriction enzyme M protein